MQGVSAMKVFRTFRYFSCLALLCITLQENTNYFFYLFLVFCFQPSVGIFGYAGSVSHEGLQDLPLSPPSESHVQAGGAEGRRLEVVGMRGLGLTS